MMKHLALFFSLCLSPCCVARLQAQSYTPFFMDQTEWTMEKVYPTLGPGDNADYWRLYTTTDTIINDQVYRQLVLKKWCKHLYANGQLTVIGNFTHNDFAIGALRESDKKVYFYKYSIPAEWLSGGFESVLLQLADEQAHLLYDFNAVPGDTVWCSNNQFTIVNDLLTPQMGLNRYQVTPRNTFLFPNETGAWTEGIGSSYGLFGSYDSYLHYLICFKQNGTPLLFNGNCSPCGNTVGEEEPTADSDSVIAFPNPFSDRVTFQSGPQNRMLRVRLWSPEGRLLYQSAEPGPLETLTMSISGTGAPIPVLAQITLEKGYQTLWLLR